LRNRPWVAESAGNQRSIALHAILVVIAAAALWAVFAAQPKMLTASSPAAAA
jgi:hypothetical protein